MARFCPLFSGSSGNATYIGCAGGGILVDVGVSAKGVTGALTSIGVDIETIEAIFITHEHSDHIKGLRVLASRHHIPVYTSFGTLEALGEASVLNENYRVSVIDTPMEAGGMLITPFATSHDSRESIGFRVELPDQRKIAVCTDLGYVSAQVRESIGGCDLVMIESNHDLMMLQNGRYPYFLKRRIMGEEGHLSNGCCAEELPGLISRGATRIVLAHLSRDNNYPELAVATAEGILGSKGMVKGRDYLLSAAAPHGGKMLVF